MQQTPAAMELIYARMRKRARQIVSRFPPPVFYRDFARALDLSRQAFNADPVLSDLRLFVSAELENDFGHGLEHAVKVTLDAGALMIIEGKRAGYSQRFLARRVLVVQCAGLLHDIKRKHQNHAVEGAKFSRKLLQIYPLMQDEIADICSAIRNHEAFRSTVPINTPEGVLVADCLYDADKFRWGPDNFNSTLWEMVTFHKTPLSKFVEGYSQGMQGLAKIKETFRTQTGKKYGPQFIEIGLAVGEELFGVIQKEFICFR